MRVAMIGLGKMGGNMATRLIGHGHEVIAYDPQPAAVEAMVALGAQPAHSREGAVAQLGEPAAIWLMIPSQFVDVELDALLPLLAPGTILIDGGNSDFRHTTARAKRCKQHGITMLDVGTSGGILGLEHGYALMVGGDAAAVEQVSGLFESLAPPDGWRHFGESGAGHFVKMVHNAIEYGLMESYAEGYQLLHDGPYHGIDLAAVGHVWQQGSIVQSLLNDLTRQALAENPELEGIDGFVSESGEARWALEVGAQHNVAMWAIQAALDMRLHSQRGEVSFATKLLAAQRNKFGGHAINGEQH